MRQKEEKSRQDKSNGKINIVIGFSDAERGIKLKIESGIDGNGWKVRRKTRNCHGRNRSDELANLLNVNRNRWVMCYLQLFRSLHLEENKIKAFRS